jgi:hypothetical protein
MHTRKERHPMNLSYAVDRLYEAGWSPSEPTNLDLESLPDGRRFPSVLAVQREFARAGLELSIKNNLMFHCYRATWAPVGEALDPSAEGDERHGTVVGACEREAAVYALSQLRAAQAELDVVDAPIEQQHQFAAV